MLTFGSLFAGIGGFDLGFERAGMVCKWQVEIDEYCSAVLAKHWPDVTRYRDVRKVHGSLSHAEQQGDRAKDKCKEVARPEAKRSTGWIARSSNGLRTGRIIDTCPSCLPPVDVICGGFPCQPFSAAGKRRGAEDDRNLWPEFRRIVEEVRPRWVVAENVPGIVKIYLDTVLSDLEGLGYTTAQVVIPACAVDAPHRRDRLWIVAHDNAVRRGWRPHDEGQAPAERNGAAAHSADVAYSSALHVERCQPSKQKETQFEQSRRKGWGSTQSQLGGVASRLPRWMDEPRDVPRVATGIPNRVQRLRALGNAVVPQVAEFIGRLIVEADHDVP
jgi:DNA (cytosine-5)-methyltransferase 1